MRRITFHLTNVKPKMVTIKKYNEETKKFDFSKKKIIKNTISSEHKTDEEGIAYMHQFLSEKENQGLKVTKYYFSNVK